MKKLFKDLSMFKKLLYSYLAILLVSVVTMVLFTNTYFIDTVKDVLIKGNENMLSALKDNVDMNIDEIEEIRDRVAFGGDYGAYYKMKDTARIMELQEELAMYVNSNSFIEDIAIYIDNDEYIYSSRSSYKIPFFIENAFRYESWSEEELVNDLKTLKAPYIRAEERVTHFGVDEKKLITFIYPLFDTLPKKCGAMIFFVDKESINNLASVDFGADDSSVYILDRNNNIIARCAGESNIFEESIKTIEKSDTAKIKRINGENYLVSVVESEDNSWRYVSFTKEKTALGKSQKAQKMIILLFVVMMLLGSVVIYYITKFNYKPIQMLKSYADSVKPGGSGNEISDVIDTIDYLNDKNKTLLNSFTDMTKEHIVDNLLKGNIKILEGGYNYEELGVSFSFDYYLTAVLLFHNDVDIDTLFEKIQALVENNYNGWAKNYHDRNKIVLILARDTTEVDYANISRLHMDIKEIAGERVSMGVGEVCFGIEDIPNSYMQASTALDYRVIKGADKVIFHDEVVHYDDSFDEYPHKELKILRFKLKEGDVKEIETVLADIIDYVITCNVSLYIARGLCFDLINTVCEAVAEINQEFIIPQKYYINVDHITKYETVEDLMESVRNICTNLCALITENKAAKRDNLLAELIEFTDKNYTDVNFSIQKMADEFGMTMTNLSQYFKNHTGNTINDYVTDLRIKKAQELLVKTDKTLTEITEEVGYINTSSFIRRFKQITGVTPGQFAKMNKL